MATTSDLSARLAVALASPAARDELLSSLGILTFGKIFYVNADSNSDGTPKGLDSNDGLSMDTALATVLAAYNKTTSNNHDYIVMSGSTGHAFTAELAVSKNRVHFLGIGGGSRYIGQRTRWTMSTGGSANSAVVYVTGVGCTFTNIKIFNTDTSTSFAVADGGEFTQWTNCEMVNTVNLGTVTDAHLLCEVDTGYFLRCSIGSSQVGHAFSGSRGCVLFSKDIRSGGSSGNTTRDTIFEDCIFPMEANSATGSCCFLLTTATDIERILWVKNCVFWGTKLSDTINRAIEQTSNQTDGDILLQNCIVHGIDGITADSTTAVYMTSNATGDLAAVSVVSGE